MSTTDIVGKFLLQNEFIWLIRAIFSEKTCLILNCKHIFTHLLRGEKKPIGKNFLGIIGNKIVSTIASVFVLGVISFPSLQAEAGFFATLISGLMSSKSADSTLLDPALNSQNMALLQATLSPNGNLGKGGGDITIVGSALLPESGPAGTLADVGDTLPVSDQISVYTVRKGDSISAIAKMFGVSVNTIMWANDLKNGIIREGQVLVILPLNGVRHIVKKGDTLASIAKSYKGDVDEIADFNNISASSLLDVGEEILVPNGSLAVVPSKSVSVSTKTTSTLRGTGGPELVGYYIRPVFGGVISQGLHGYNGVDLAAPRGTTIVAAAKGTVIISRGSGWNGGYGNYIVIQHPNGTQTLYSHLTSVVAREGAEVEQGQLIGYSGSTGKSTGPHLHFEVRGAKNPFAK